MVSRAIQEFEIFLQRPPDTPYIFQTLCTTWWGTSLDSPFPTDRPLSKGENIREKFPELTVIWKALLSRHHIPPISFQRVHESLDCRMILDRSAHLRLTT